MHWLLIMIAGRGIGATYVALYALRHRIPLDDGARQFTRIVWAIGMGLWASYYLILGS